MVIAFLFSRAVGALFGFFPQEKPPPSTSHASLPSGFTASPPTGKTLGEDPFGDALIV